MSATAIVLGDESSATDAASRSVLSYNLLKEVLQTSNIEEDEEAVMVTRMRVDPRHVKEFERILRLILKNTHTIGHVSTCVVKPPPGEYTYTSIVKYSSLDAMRQIYPSTVENGGLDFYKLFAARDSLLIEPPTYQIEAGFGTWIESDGHTRPMRDDADDCNMVYNTIPKPCCDDSCDNPHGLNVRASFVAPTKHFQLFQPRYQRNNKKGGQKNLRCFPCCRNGRHVSSGFCGDSIRVHVAVSRITESGGIKICPISTTTPAVLAYARFLNLEGSFDPTVSGPEVFPGQTIEKYELLTYVRDKEHPLNPLFTGILRGAAMESTLQSAIFEFNAECKAWHYGWTAPRGQGLSGSDAQHVLEILFMKPMGSYLFCLERLRSDTFSIYSSRRASHATATVKPEAEAYENDDDLDDDRGQKRKRALGVPPSPSLSVGSSSQQVNSTPTWTPTSFVSELNNTPQPQPQQQQQTTAGDVTFKLEPTSPSQQHAFATSDNFSNMLLAASSQGLFGDHQQQFTTTATPQQPMVDFSTPPNSTTTSSSSTGGAGGGATGFPGSPLMAHVSGDLVDHMLFGEHGSRRVVSSEELPWSELYNLFDNVPMPLASDGGDDDLDDDSPVSSPTPSQDSTTTTATNATTNATTGISSMGATAILTYL